MVHKIISEAFEKLDKLDQDTWDNTFLKNSNSDLLRLVSQIGNYVEGREWFERKIG